MNLHDIAVQGEWRTLVTPGLRGAFRRLETQGVTFAWRHDGDLAVGAYLFEAELNGVLLASRDGSEMPRQAISEVILAAMTACGTFSNLSRTRQAGVSVPSSGAS